MCEVLDRIENKGIEQSIQNLMETLHLTLEQAMDALKIDPSKRPFYLQKFNR